MFTGTEYMTEESGQGLIVREDKVEPVAPNSNGHKALASVEPAAETAEDAALAQSYRGIRGWLRLFKVSRVIGLLSLYLYLDRYDLHYGHIRRFAEQRLEKARQLGPLAVMQVRLNGVGSWFFDKGVRLTSWFVYRGSHKEEVQQKQAVWLRDNLIKLGPTFIKIGQSLGTRADLLPLNFVKELGTLQDEVPPFDNAEAHARIERELKRTLKEAFLEFDVEPIAAASLGQVYRARLHSGEEVAVKVQRPHLAAMIAGDIHLLQKIAGYAARFPKLNENADWAGMLHEFEETIQEEMDYAQEGRNAERFRDNFKTWQNIYVPTIYWSHTSKKVLTLEFIRGTKVIESELLAAKGLSAANTNRLLIKTYLKQLLEDGFFHADPHPGNLLVMNDGRLAFFDFGMVGRITAKLQSKMIDAFFHVVAKDPAGIAQDLIELDFLKPGVDPHVVKPIVERLFQHYLNLKFKEVNFKELTYELADVMYDYPFRLPSNFTYIMRALMTLEGIGIRIDPEFNFFETAKPFAKEFTLRREGKQFRQLILDKLTGKDTDGDIDWGKMWKLAKMAVKALITP
jgi:predicted unusual protein kinase regulating ubiquinone biosynthesis (AarF/ABC1/UbiB family)